MGGWKLPWALRRFARPSHPSHFPSLFPGSNGSQTAPSCPAGDFLVEDIRQKVGSVDGIKDVNVNIVFEPEWTKEMMSEEAKLELGFL